jgi:hypothetical protein
LAEAAKAGAGKVSAVNVVIGEMSIDLLPKANGLGG